MKSLFAVLFMLGSCLISPLYGQQEEELRRVYSIDPLYLMAIEDARKEIRTLPRGERSGAQLAAFFDMMGVKDLTPAQFGQNNIDQFVLTATRALHEDVAAALLRFHRGKNYRTAFVQEVALDSGDPLGIMEKKWRMPQEFLCGVGKEFPKDEEALDVKEGLICLGVTFPKGSSAVYDVSREILTVRNRASDLKNVDAAVNLYLSQCPLKGRRYGALGKGKKEGKVEIPFLNALKNLKVKRFDKSADFFVFCSLHGIADAKPVLADEMLRQLNAILEENKSTKRKVALAVVVDKKKDMTFLQRKKCKVPVVKWKDLIKSDIACRFPDPFLRSDVVRIMNVYGGVVCSAYGITAVPELLREYMEL